VLKKLLSALTFVLLGAGASAGSTYDATTNLLVLDSVLFNGITYNNVTVRLNSYSVLKVGSSSEPVTPPTSNPGVSTAPVANPGPAQNVSPGSKIAASKVTLDGSASSDPNGAPLTYQWTLTSKPAGSDTVITSPTTAVTNIWTDGPGLYLASLVVNNGTESSAPSTVVITAAAIPPPVSKPGADQNAAVSTVVTLNGSQSNDPTGIALASHQWTLISAPAGGGISIHNAHGAIAQFIPTAVGDYVFELQVGGWRNGGINYVYERTTVHVHN